MDEGYESPQFPSKISLVPKVEPKLLLLSSSSAWEIHILVGATAENLRDKQ